MEDFSLAGKFRIFVSKLRVMVHSNELFEVRNILSSLKSFLGLTLCGDKFFMICGKVFYGGKLPSLPAFIWKA